MSLRHTVMARLDEAKLGPWHAMILMACAFGFAFDLAEVSLGGVLSVVYSAPPNPAAPSQLSWLLVAPYIGGIVGAPMFGWLSDRWGRRRALMLVLLLLGGLSIPTAFAPSIESLTVLRGLCGLSLGAYPPVMMAYLTDLLPARSRGPLLLVVCAVASIGAAASVLIIRWLTPIEPLGFDAWRWLLVVSGGVSLMLAGVFVFLPEPVRWLLKAGKVTEAMQVYEKIHGPLDLSRANGDTAPAATATLTAPKPRQQVVLGLLSFLNPWVAVAFPLLSGAVLIERGMVLPDALLYVALSSFGPFVGTLLISPLSDRFGRRPLMWLSLAAILIGGGGFILSSEMVGLAASGFVVMTGISMYVTVHSIYNSELFPTETRGRATSLLWALNRLGAIVAPLTLLPLLHSVGVNVFYLVLGLAVAASVAGLFLAPGGKAGQTLN